MIPVGKLQDLSETPHAKGVKLPILGISCPSLATVEEDWQHVQCEKLQLGV